MAVTVAGYMKVLPSAVRPMLEALRATIRAAAPEAEEFISYGMPSYRQDGMLLGFRASKAHCSLHTWNSSTIAAMAKELKGFDTAPGTIRFTLDKPLPAALVKKIVARRLKENAAHAAELAARKKVRGK